MKLEHNKVYLVHARNSYVALWDEPEEVFIVPRYKLGARDTIYEVYVDVIKELDVVVPEWHEADDLTEFLHKCAAQHYDEYDPRLEPEIKYGK